MVRLFGRLAVAVLAACGGGSSAPPDSTQPADGSLITDAAIEAPWTVGTIKVTARDGNPYMPGIVPAANTSVVFSDAAGETQVVATDANGVASATVTGPTTVTHVQAWSSVVTEAIAIIGAQPGDDLLLERVNRSYTPIAPLSVTFTPVPNTDYRACSPCGCTGFVTTSPAQITMYDSCQASSVDVVLLASTATTLTYATGSAAYDATAGGTIALAPTLATTSHTGTFTAIPTEVGSLHFQFVASSADDRTEVTAPGSTANLDVRGWSGLPAYFNTIMFRTDGAKQTITAGVGTGTSGFAFDGTQDVLPWLGVATHIPATHTFRAPALPGTRDGDVFIGTFSYGTIEGKGTVWTVIAEAPGEFALPEIPPSVAELTPMPGLGTYGTGMVIESPAVNGYAEARRDAFALWRQAFQPGNARMLRSETERSDRPYAP